MAVGALLSVTGYVIVAGVYNYLLLPFVIPLSSASPSAGGGSLPGRVTQTFIPQESGPFAVLGELCC